MRIFFFRIDKRAYSCTTLTSHRWGLDSPFGFRPTHAAAEPPRVEQPAKLNAAALVLLMIFRTTSCIVPALAAVALRFFDGLSGALFDAGALRFFSSLHFLQ